jgi:hypothetical protein
MFEHDLRDLHPDVGEDNFIGMVKKTYIVTLPVMQKGTTLIHVSFPEGIKAWIRTNARNFFQRQWVKKSLAFPNGVIVNIPDPDGGQGFNFDGLFDFGVNAPPPERDEGESGHSSGPIGFWVPSGDYAMRIDSQVSLANQTFWFDVYQTDDAPTTELPKGIVEFGGETYELSFKKVA